MRIRKKHFAIVVLVFIATWFVLFIGPIRGAELIQSSRPISLAIRPLSYAAWHAAHEDDWWRLPRESERPMPWQIGTIRTSYDSIGGLPVRRDYLLAFETGSFGGLFRAATTRFVFGGITWQPAFRGTEEERQSAFFIGVKANF